MIINRIHLHPFAGVVNSEQFFYEGLNVICGPNEAGKSTFVKALTMALFTPVDLTPARERETLKDVLPVTGGDTIRVDLDFTVGHQEYKLLKCWGGKKAVRLILPDGNDISNDIAVTEKMTELLELNEATYRNVLITYQSALGRTIQQLQDEKEVRNTLSERLRNSVMQQDNIPVDDFYQKLIEKLEEYYGNWDIKTNGPRNNRGIENKYLKGNGCIINSYYHFKALEQQLKEALEYERQLEALTIQLREAEEKLEITNTFLKENKAVVNDVQQRGKLEAELEKINVLYEKFNKDYQQWPVLENNLKTADKSIVEELQTLKKLETELKIAQQKQESLALKHQYLQASKLRERLEQLSKNNQALPEICEADLLKVDELERRLQKLKIQIEAQKLKFSVLSKSDLEITLQTGLQQEQVIKISKDEILSREVKGKFTLNIPNLQLSVESGNEDIPALIGSLKENSQRLEDFLHHWKVRDIPELKALYKKSQEIASEQKQIQAALNNELKGKSFDELEVAFKQLEELPAVRSVNVLNEEIVSVKTKIQVADSDKRNSQQQLNELINQHSSQRDLMSRLVKGEQKREETELKLKNLAAIPKGFQDAADFIAKYEDAFTQNQELSETVNILKDKKRELQKLEPEMSVEDLNDALKSAEESFARTKREGEAYLMIKAKLEDILKNIDEQTYRPLQDAVNKYISAITGDKYHELILKEALPISLYNSTKKFQISHLSKGTLDAAALALRLGMAEFYLAERDGFVIMDDPFVDMDESRQRAAADTIIEYAEQRQVIIYTCHQRHAEILCDHFVMMN